MATTSDERREVAARLRDCIVYAKKHDLNGDCDMESDKCVETRNTLYNDIASCIEEYGNFNLSAEDVFTRLADLIDPTCEVESIEPIRAGEFNQAIGSAFHLTCGHTAWRACTDEPPVYCEECGARITEVE